MKGRAGKDESRIATSESFSIRLALLAWVWVKKMESQNVTLANGTKDWISCGLPWLFLFLSHTHLLG